MWTDNETTSDLIGFRVHADLIRSVVTDPNLLPVTIGVFGDWGGGKTSIMRMLEQDLQPEGYTDPEEKSRYEQVACLYFNGWLFEGYDDAKSALLSAVLLALGEHKRFGPKVRDKAVSLLKSVNWMRLARLGFREVALPAAAAYVSGGASLLPSAASVVGRLTGTLLGNGGGTELGKENEEEEAGSNSSEGESKIDWESLIKKDKEPASPLDVRSFRDRFADLLNASDISTLVILIDDLDRCSPERIIDNLEAIKLFLNVPGTAFVIGADPRIVRHAIATRYSTGEVLGRERQETEDRLIDDYLEKLIQIPYWLPRLSPAEIETYIVLLFCNQSLEGNEWQRCLAASAIQRAENHYGVFGYAAVRAALGGEELSPRLTESLALASGIAPLVTEGLKGNPRQVKRFLNAFALRKKLAVVANLTNVRDDILVKLMILEYAQSKAFRQLFDWQAAQKGTPIEIRTMENLLRENGIGGGEEGHGSDMPWTNDFLRRWILMSPQLSDVDLRDYFWVARDRLAATFSSLSMVPPIVRRTFEDLVSENSGRRAAGISAASTMEGSQLEILLDMLGTQIVRHPDIKAGYDAFRALIERNVGAALTAFVEVAAKVPASRVPPAVGLDLRTLVSAHAEFQSYIQPILDSWANTSSTRVGRALQPRQERRH